MTAVLTSVTQQDLGNPECVCTCARVLISVYKVVMDFMCAGAEVVATGQLPSSRHRQGFLAAAAELPRTETASPLFPTGLLLLPASLPGSFLCPRRVFSAVSLPFRGSLLLFSLVSRHHYGAHIYPVLYILKPAIIP